MSENHEELQKQHLSFLEVNKLGYKPLELQDKHLFSQKFKEFQPEISEFTFTNLYMWREYYRFAWKHVNGIIVLIALYNPTKLVVFPLIGDDFALWIKELDLLKIGFNLPIEIHRVPETFIKNVKSMKKNIKIYDDRDNWDYVYYREDLINLSGKEYATIRRKLNKFNREYQVKIEPLTQEYVKLCLHLQEEWCNLRACSDTPSLENEDKAIRDILLHIDQLDFVGFVLILEDRVIGYSIGEKLNDSTIITHIEKGNSDYFGLYQALNFIFADKYATNYSLLNREQDLGIPGLRRSKESYHPNHFVKKFIVEF